MQRLGTEYGVQIVAGSTEQNFDVLGLDGLLKMIRTLLSF